ncbi:PTS fructose transporter subunit IIA [Comamonas sp. Y6]|uniref:PTS fructose transporter subunit IIA n=1 Tax=Comamonas resistens TaxID=3046670 RepID=A0ABY8SSZ3_9BURK|nr:PTS fructose transporter subunit IIA [Comamonas resistens]MDL5039245.1 PTS fructose transporter subunit IIA [Comamonas resistens]WHS65865.1 PTS fructose transporter subunit IIA [Comamonas resistens]
MTTRILLLTHAPLASALRECALHVFADSADDVLALDVPASEAPEATLERAQALLAAHGGMEVSTLVLTDLFGATPCNVAQRLTAQLPARLVAGVNLPMLLRSIGYRHEPLDELVSRAMVGGSQGVMQVASSSRQNQSARPSHDQDQHHHQQ